MVIKHRQPSRVDDGFAMGALLVGIFIMSLLTSMALPVWHHAAQREREAELIFRGQQYARAIALWQRQRPGSVPQDLDTLIEERFLRKRYSDPMTNGGQFRILLQSDLPSISASQIANTGTSSGMSSESTSLNRGPAEEAGCIAGGIVGVVSTSADTSISSYNGRNQYDEWFFIYTENAELDTPQGQTNTNSRNPVQDSLGVGPAPR